MSRNFELLTEIGAELEATTCDRDLAGTVRTAAKANASNYRGDACQEEMLRLIQRVFLSPDGGAPRKVVFCGVGAESGSSSVCARAGRTLATHSNGSVCMVDANVRSPRLSSKFGVDTTTSVSCKSASMHEQCVQVGGKLWLARTDVLTVDSGALASTEELKERLAQLRGEFEYVLIDGPGTDVCDDASLLGQVADAVILVIEANRTRRLTARKAEETLEAAGVRLLGTVIYNRTFPIPEKIYRLL
jgi:Mrp family chromosome partitioning ATPase